jgi:23S rRNA pseudouridine1911/1915/1917 synthase
MLKLLTIFMLMKKNNNSKSPPFLKNSKGAKPTNKPLPKANEAKDTHKGWVVPATAGGIRLPNFIAEKLPSQKAMSLRHIKTLLEKGACKVNGRIEKFASRKLIAGEVVSFILDKDVIEPIKERVVLSKSNIVFEDEYLIAFDKPAGLACGPMEHDEHNNLRVYLEELINLPKLIMVHRLDKDTSGIILYAKTIEVSEILLKMFKDREIQKTYEAIVDGIVAQEDGSIDKKMFLKSKGQGWEKWGVTRGEVGKTAVTRFQKIKTIGKFASYLELKPLTGRTHQIRVHLESIGHPILGDHFYGNNFLCHVTFAGHLLHARSLTFKHPITKENMILKTEKPPRFIAAEQKIAKNQL